MQGKNLLDRLNTSYALALYLGILYFSVANLHWLQSFAKLKEQFPIVTAEQVRGISDSSVVSAFGPKINTLKAALQSFVPVGGTISFATDDQDTFRIQNMQYDLAPYVVAFEQRDRYVVGFFDSRSKAEALRGNGLHIVFEEYPFYIFKAGAGLTR